jgi:hypothetical protein
MDNYLFPGALFIFFDSFMHITARQAIHKCISLSCLLSLLSVIWGCTSPEARFFNKAKSYGFKQKIVQGTVFKHVVYFNKKTRGSDVLHIYLDGDGSAWINKRWISANPTPRNALMLKLMQQDKEAALYLGRPCYHGFSADPPCSNKLWTSHRYSPLVVDALVAAIREIVSEYNPKHVVLIGYSGGGALAMLVAEHFSDISGIITIAANLDINAWTDYHGYSRLTGSLNPIDRKKLDKKIFQLHLAGGKDLNIPANQIRSFVEKNQSSSFLFFNEYDHHCCWEQVWPSILDSIQFHDRRM